MAATTRVRIPVRSYVGRVVAARWCVFPPRVVLRISRRDVRIAFWFMLRSPCAMIEVHVIAFCVSSFNARIDFIVLR